MRLGLNLTLQTLHFINRVYLCVLHVYDYHNKQRLFPHLRIGGRNNLRVKCKGLKHGASFHGFTKSKQDLVERRHDIIL